MSKDITFEDFNKIDIRVGTILEVYDLTTTINPSFILKIDFGLLGVLKTSAQITKLYDAKNLIGTQIIAVVNFPDKQIANMKSSCLVLGAVKSDNISLIRPESNVLNGSVIS